MSKSTSMHSPHVVHLTSVHQPFDQRIFHKECRTLAQNGFRVTLIAPSSQAPTMQDGVEIRGVRPPTSRRHRIETWRKILATTRRLQPDLVHFHDPELLTLTPLLRQALGARTPIVYDVHEYFIESFAHKVWIPTYLRTAAAQAAALSERTLGRTVDGLVFVVDEQLPYYADWPAAKTIIHNYPIVANFAPATQSRRPADGRFTMIHLGSLFARRGIMTMLEAMPIILNDAPDALLILGGKFESQTFQQKVERFVHEQDLHEHVQILAWIDYAELGATLAQADVGWLPLPWNQQYAQRNVPTKLLEFMLVGLPVVTSNNLHARVFVEEANCGMVAAADVPAAHAQAMLHLYHHPEERKAMGQRGRESVLAHYTWEREGARLVAFYKELLQQTAKNVTD